MRRPVSWVAVLLVAGCSPPVVGAGAPSVPGSVDYQLGGSYPPAAGVDVVVRDRSGRPDPDRWSVCYVNVFQTQPGSHDVPADLLLRNGRGARVEDPDWPGEFLLDISTPDRRERVADLVGGWFDDCAAAGFQAVEPDNLDSWTRSGTSLTAGDAGATARLLVDRAHAAGLQIAQKNAAELTGAGLGFDFAVAEDCAEFDECATYADAYDRVLDIEYSDTWFAAACAAHLPGVAVQRRDRAVSTPGTPGYVARWCPS